MTITYPLSTDFLHDFPGWTTEFDLLWRQEQSRMALGMTIVKDMGSPLWRMSVSSISLRSNELDYWRARLTSLENGLKTFRAFPKSRCYPIAYPNGSWADFLGNKVSNPGFESGAAGWLFGATASLSTNARTGSQALALTKSGGAGASSLVRIPVVGGAQYTLTAWVKANIASAAGCNIRANWFASAIGGTVISVSDSASNVALTTDYVQRGATVVTAPADATHVQIQLFHLTASTATTMFVDDVDFRVVAGASFDGTNAAVNTINANRKAVTLKGLPAGYVVSVGDYVQIGAANLHQVMEPAKASGSGTTSEFEIRPHLWPASAVNDAVVVKRPSCIMAIVPGSISSTAELATGRGVISFQAIEAR